MEAFLLGLIAAAPGPLQPLVALVVGGILRTFQWTNSLLTRVRGNWNPLSAAARLLDQGLASLAGEVYNTVKHIIVTRLPAWAQAAINAAVRWAADRITEARNLAQALVTNAVTWARNEINLVRQAITAGIRWAAERIAELVGAVNRLLDRVFNLLGTPERIALWIVGAMWSALWRYAWGQRDRFIDAARPVVVALLLRAAAEIERQIARVL